MRKILLRTGLMVLLASIMMSVVGAKGCLWWRDKNNADTISGSSGTLPAQVTSPYPVNSATYLPITEQLSWAVANGATSYDVYFGITSTGWAPVTNTTGTNYKVGTLFASTTYYWRVDSKNATGITSGNVWSFRFDSVTNLTVGIPFQLAPSIHVVSWPTDIVYGGGKYLAAWYSNHEGTWNVYGRIVNLDESLGSVIGVATATGYAEVAPVVAYHESGKWLVVYGDYRSGSSEYYGRFLNGDGTPDGSSFLIRSPGDTYRPSVVAVPIGFFVVLPVGDNVYGKMVYLNGTVGSNVEISANESVVETFPYAVAAPGLDKILVVWLDDKTVDIGPNGVEISGRFVNATTGNPIGNDFVVVPDGPSWPQKPSALEYNNKDNTFMIAWEDNRGTSWDIWAEHLDANGAIIGNEFQLNDANAASETDPDIAYNPVIDKYLAIWWANTSVMKAKILNSDGTVIGSQFDIPGTHQPFVAASRTDDSFIVPGTDGITIKVPSQ